MEKSEKIKLVAWSIETGLIEDFDERIVFCLKKRFCEKMKYRELAEALEISRQRVFQIIQEALVKIKRAYKSKVYDKKSFLVLKPRTYNALMRAGYKTSDDLPEDPMILFDNTKSLGSKGLQEIIKHYYPELI